MIRGVVQHVIFQGADAFMIAKLASLEGLYTIKGSLWGVSPGDEIEVDGEEKPHPKYGPQITVRTHRFLHPTPAQREIEESLLFLKEELGLKKRGDEIFRKWGGEAKRRILANPYELAQEVSGIGFKIADEIATKLGIDDHDARRVDECVLHVMRNASEGQGHVFLSRRQVEGRAAEFLGMDFNGDERIDAAIARLCADRTVGFRTESHLVEETIGDRKIYYLRSLWDHERAAAALLDALVAEEPLPLAKPDDEDLSWLSEEQKQVILSALSERILVVTGGPGVGKTACIKALVDTCRKWNIDIGLCAPTGRAAKRLQEATEHDALTVHRILQYNPRTEEWPDFKLDHKIVVCDEASMLDMGLAHVLLRAVSGGIVFVGDADQLEPVGPGAFFKDLCRSGQVPIVRLTKNFRQDKGYITSACEQILARSIPEYGRDPKTDDLFKFTYGQAERGAAMIVELVTKKIPETFGIPTKDIQVLCPNHDGAVGDENLNRMLQAAVQGRSAEEGEFLIGDRIIQKKNDHERYVMNGDVGTVLHLLKQGGAVVDFGGTEYEYDAKALRGVDLAYAVSIHKAQGSEYPAVVIVGHSPRPGFLTRNMLYTAVSRGRKLVCIVHPAGSKTIEEAVSTDGTPRNSRLLALIKGEE